jgi:hypothetical protein
MKKLFTPLLTLISLNVFSQKIDTVLNNGVYKSFVNYELKQPVYVVYKLYKGGGSCSRAGFAFKNDTQVNYPTTKYG